MVEMSTVNSPQTSPQPSPKGESKIGTQDVGK